MNRDEILARLISEFHYPPGGAEKIADRLENCSIEILQAFETWWQTGQESALSIHSYSVSRLEREHGMNPVAAFLTLDWLMKEPRLAVLSLKKGHDRIIKK